MRSISLSSFITLKTSTSAREPSSASSGSGGGFRLSKAQAWSVLAALGREGMGTVHRRPIVNDVLIAVTAAKSGAVLVTRNTEDFARIERHLSLRWMPLD
ncbi:MAG: type II toxin-antitoxin system VapC family toxin [Pirellulales bacterium]